MKCVENQQCDALQLLSLQYIETETKLQAWNDSEQETQGCL